MSQMSLFSAGAHEPRLDDLEGLLAGPGQVVRRGAEARISVVVADGWRVEALTEELDQLGLQAQIEPAEPGSATVGTPWSAELRRIADAWTRGAVKQPPPGWVIDGGALRWWCIAAGRGPDQPTPEAADGAVEPTPEKPAMYTLALGPSDESAWGAVGAALAAAGVAGALVGPRADGPAYRIVGRRRLLRLRELVGDAPNAVPVQAWPADQHARV